MKKLLIVISLLFLSCTTGNLNVVASLPKTLNEVSGIQYNIDSNDFWMLNDGGNPNEIYKVSLKGKITKVLEISTKNNDWEEITKDDLGNLYIGDFGNNDNERKNLRVLIVNQKELQKGEISVEEIKFSYPDQKDFPPKKKKRFFDAEAMIFLNRSIYIFTKSRVKDNFGRTNVYKIPAKKGEYIAKFVSTYDNCSENLCWITGAALSPDESKLALLSQANVTIFSNFKTDDFFTGEKYIIPFSDTSQKESISFKDNNTIYIADERTGIKGGNLYQLKLNKKK